MTRLVAFDKKSKTFVNVSLRGLVTDLTEDFSTVPAYTHISRRTIAGRVKLGPKGYLFERIL